MLLVNVPNFSSCFLFVSSLCCILNVIFFWTIFLWLLLFLSVCTIIRWSARLAHRNRLPNRLKIEATLNSLSIKCVFFFVSVDRVFSLLAVLPHQCLVACCILFYRYFFLLLALCVCLLCFTSSSVVRMRN